MQTQTYLKTISAAPGQYVQLVTSDGPPIPCLLTNPNEGQVHVEDFGAVGLPITTTPEEVPAGLRAANVAAFRAAFDAAFEITRSTLGECVILMGPLVYFTDDWVGYDLHADANVPVTLRGQGQMSMIYSNNDNASVLKFSTDDGNIRDLLVQDIMLHGGREGLQLYNCDYSSFERIWGWGSKNFAFQLQFCVGTDLVDCRFDESAQGNATGVEADALLLLSCEVTVTDGTRWGEFCGGIVMSNGYNQIGGLFHDCKLRRGIFWDYQTNTEINIDGGALLTRPAAITISGGFCLLDRCFGESVARWVLAFRGVELAIGDVRIQAAPGFVGFVDVWPDGSQTPATDLALTMRGTFNFNDLDGFLIGDLESSLHNAVIDCQVITGPNGHMTPIATSAPRLLNPHFDGNNVSINQYSRFFPTLVPEVTALLDLTRGTVAGTGYSSVPDDINTNPAVQTTDARRPVNGVSNGFPTATFDAANNSCLSWPLTPQNNQITKTGYCQWLNQPASGGPERWISIGGGTGGANAQKCFIELDTTQRVTVVVFANNSGGRSGQTANGAFVAGEDFFLRWAYDSSQATEALRCKLYINEVLQTLTFADFGGGGVPTTLPVAVGNLLIGNLDNSGSSSQGLNGTIGSWLACVAGDVSAQNGLNLMRFRPPVAV